jgi:protein arginine kinase
MSDSAAPRPSGEPGSGQKPGQAPLFDAMTEWLRAEGDCADVVMSSRVRLARNIAGHKFGTRGSRHERQNTLETCRDCVLNAGIATRFIWCDVHDASPLDRTLLVERHLISKQLSKGRASQSGAGEDPRGVAIGLPDERLSIMVNEEDHLRLQLIRSGLALTSAWRQLDEIDDRIEAGVDYAYSPRFGYLTACPTNVGTGLRMSVMLHLPGLRLTREIDKVKRAAADMSLAVRGFYGEGSDAVGDLFQLSNQTTLGKTEAQILDDMERQIVPRIVEYERISRRELLSQRRIGVEDHVMRAWGLLSNARLLGTEEAMQALSLVRLGVLLGIIKDKSAQNLDVRHINQLLLVIQPAHLQRAVGKDLDQEQRKVARATLVRTRIAAIG